MVRGVRALGMEACCTLGMLTEDQAQRLAEAGLTAYNHNLDTSRSLLQVDHHRRARTTTACARWTTSARPGITVCCGGIIGMGESIDDRCAMLATLANLDPAARERAGERAGDRCPTGSGRRLPTARRSIRSSWCG